MNASKLSGFDAFDFTHDDRTLTVYRRGHGPGVMVMHEIPGITPQVQACAERVAEAGFTVFMPCLFGTPGKPLSVPYVAVDIAFAVLRCAHGYGEGDRRGSVSQHPSPPGGIPRRVRCAVSPRRPCVSCAPGNT
jgi:dienelactone hydrolase